MVAIRTKGTRGVDEPIRDFTIQIFIEAPGVKEYPLMTKADAAFTILSASHKCGSGSVDTMDVHIGGVDVTGLANINVATGAVVTDNATAANAVAIGDRVSLDIKTITAPANVEVMLSCRLDETGSTD